MHIDIISIDWKTHNQSINQTAGTVAALRGKFTGAVWLPETLAPKGIEVLNKIAIFLTSLFISVVFEIILLAFVGFIHERFTIWAIITYPLIFIFVFITLFKNYSNGNYYETNINYSILESKKINSVDINTINYEYNVSVEYLKHIRLKIVIELSIMSLGILFLALLLITAISESKISPILPMFLFFIVAIPSSITVFTYYRNLLKEAHSRKVIFSNDTISIFNQSKNLEVIDLHDIHKIKVRRNKKSNLIEYIQIFLIKGDSTNSDIKLEGYHDMDIIFKRLTHAQ